MHIYGGNVAVSTDNKPLKAILSKPPSPAPARLQRMMLRLQKYDLRWLKAVSSTFQDIDFDGSLLPFLIT